MSVTTPTPTSSRFEWREYASTAAILYAAALLLLIAGSIVFLSTAADAAPRYAPAAHVTRAGCIDHDTTRYRLHLDNRASRAAVTFELGVKRPHRAWSYRYVTVPAGASRALPVPVDTGRRVRIVAGSFDAPLIDTTRYGRDCRWTATTGRVNDHGAAPVTIVNRTARGRTFTLTADTLTGGVEAWRVTVPAHRSRTVMVGIDPAGTTVTVRLGRLLLLDVTRVAAE